MNTSLEAEPNLIQRRLPNFNDQNIMLTPSQESVVNMCIRLIPDFKIIVIKGETSSGKYTVASEIFKRLKADVAYFDLCELARDMCHIVSNQDIIIYLNKLLDEVNALMDYSLRKFPGIIYIRHYNRVADVLTDIHSKLRFLLPLILKTFSERMPPDVRILITTQGCMLPEGLHWCIDLTTTRQDMGHILNTYCLQNIISHSELQHIMRISKTVPVGRILYCMKYAIAMNKNIDTNEENNIFIESYKKALSKFSGSTVDIDRDIPNPNPEDDLVGVEDIMEEITTSIINPMVLDIPGIKLKKGLLLCGPPGTGKTSLGRWLAHKIKGKFYLIGSEAGISGSLLIDTFQMTVMRAHENSPAVVFIDDADVLFERDDTYRAFLTILDGIETNKRRDVCVVVTCMNMRNVPASLLRGGRLEMALITRLPDRKKIQIILERSLTKMKNILNNYDPTINDEISQCISKDFISNLAGRMIGWNCADIHRCVNDVSRLIIAHKISVLPVKSINLNNLFASCIKQIKDQYLLCGRCESTNIDHRPHEAYIM